MRPAQHIKASFRVVAALACNAALCVAAGCSMLMPMDSDRLQTERVEDAVLPMAEIAMQTGQLETAKRLYQRLLDVDPKSVPARMGLGEIAFRRGDSAESARWHLAAVAHAEQPEQRHAALLAHGRAALEAGQLEAARGSFAQLADPREEAPLASVAWGLNGVGLTLLLEGDLQGAITNMEQAVQRAPSEALFQENLERALAMFAESGLGLPDAQSSPAPASAAEAAEAGAAPGRASPGADPGVSSDPFTLSERAAEAQEAPPSEPRATAATLTDSASTGWSAPSDATDADKAEEFGGFVVQADGRQFVQMGAYRHRSTALTLQELLRAATDQPVRVVERPELFRVRIGPIDSEEALMALVDDLGAAGYGAVRLPASSAKKPAENGAAEAADAPQPAIEPGARAFVVQENGSRFLQFGAYKEREAAATLATRLRDLTDAQVRVSEAEIDGLILHRVRAGPIESEDALRDLVETAEAAGFAVD